MESTDQVMALCGSSLHSNHSKLSDITAGKLSVNSLLIKTIYCNKKQTCYLPRKYSVQNEGILNEQSISGKIVSCGFCEIRSHLMCNSCTDIV